MNMSAQRQAFEAWWHDHYDDVEGSMDDSWIIWQAALSQQAPVSAEALYDEIKVTLANYRLSYTEGADGEAYQLTDALSTPGGTIKSGVDEIVLICDAIYNEVLTPMLGKSQSRAQVVPAEPAGTDYRRMFNAAAQSIAQISSALGIDDDEAACANGNDLILAAIQRNDKAVRVLKSVVSHWNEFGPSDGFGEVMDTAEAFLQSDAAPAVSEPAETSVVNQSLTTAAAPSAPIEPTPVAAPETERVCMKTVCDDSCSYPHCMGDYPAAPAEPTPELTYALRDVAVERRRQIEREGWTLQHDDKHHDGAMSMAAAGYASEASEAILNAAHELDGPGEPSIHDVQGSQPDASIWPHGWTFKPATPRRMLVKAGALILAEIERLDRATPPAEQGEE